MIIYNHNKEFIGIDLKDLKSLGFTNLSELQNECKDFADLFVKRDNYIYNFTNFNWIYYILNSDLDEVKVIIATKNREFSASLEIETFYLTETPNQIAYAIHLINLKALDEKESKQNKKEVTLSEPNLFKDLYDFNTPLEIKEQNLITPDESNTQIPILEDYVFDPKVASEELGLPVDLIKEFISDFVQQTYEFKDELYNSLTSNKLTEVKLLSHKLKGIAMNLKIEDAYDTLNIINSSSNPDEMQAALDHFYQIVAKLEEK